MVNRKPKTVQFRRKREYKTDYAKRLSLLLSRKLRLVVRLTNKRILAQLIEFSPKGDKILVGVDSISLKKIDWLFSCKNFPAAYLTGLMIGKKAKEKGYEEAVFDTGFKKPLKNGKQYAFLKGVLDSGFNVPHSKGIFPDEDVISGKRISDYASKIKDNKEVYEKSFAEYLKNKVQPEKITNNFEEIKKKIMGN